MTRRKRKITKTLPYFRLLLVITLVMFEASEADEVRCPRYCLCYYDSTTDLRSVSCVARRLASIDLSIPKRVQTLDLSNNSISVLEDRAFQNYGLIELVSLVIKHNSIQTVGLHSFAGLTYLRKLDLTGNSLYQILPWTFHDNGNLKFVSLSGNPLGHVTHSGPFIDVPSLETLLLSKCNFAHFSEDAFSALPNLKVLDISHNQLIDFDMYPLQFLHNLKELDISSNPWQCNTNLESLKSFLESHSSKLIGSSCDSGSNLKEITTQETKFEKIISVGIDYQEYDDDNDDSVSDEDSRESTVKEDTQRTCSSENSTAHFYKENFILSPTLLCLISFQLGVCTTLFMAYFCNYCKRHKKTYQSLEPELTVPVEVGFQSSLTSVSTHVNGEVIQVMDGSIICPETPPPSYRELFMSEYR